MVWSDGTTHGRTKHQLFEYFRPDVLADLRDGIEAVPEARLDAALADGRTFDFAAEVAVPVPLRVVMDLVGVPREDHRQVLSWLETFRLVMNKEYSAAESANPDAMTETVAYFEDLVAERTTDGATLDDRLDVDEADLPPAEYLVTKQRYNFFHRTDIPHILDTYDVDTVILVGFMTHICVHYTAHGAHGSTGVVGAAVEGDRSDGQVLRDGVLVGQFGTGEFVGDLAPVYRVTAVGHRADDSEVLLDEQHRRPQFVVDRADVLADPVDDRGLDTLAGFV
ncbi:hypothetical protein BRC95_04310 [Halobacteriales archaeon QS_5_68_33]|nr:MAG: hypothetical protein BRC95_04310 [Halobacteriales archaeon QS_5_68_33]